MGFQLMVANHLGANGFGVLSLALASAALLAPLADAGLPNLALRLISGEASGTDSTNRLLWYKAYLSPLYILPLLGWSWLGTSSHETSSLLLCAGAFYGFQSLADLLRQILRARQQAEKEFAVRLIHPFGNLLALALLWKSGLNPMGALLALTAGPAALSFAYLFFIFPQKAIKVKTHVADLFKGDISKPIIQSVFHLALVGIATRIDAFILNGNSGNSEVGRYFAALNLASAAGFFGQGLSAYLYPRLHRQIENRSRAISRALAIQLALGLSLFLSIWLIGPSAFRFVFRSTSFLGADALLPGMGVVVLVTTLDWLWLSILIGHNRIWIAAINLFPLILFKLLLAPPLVHSMGAKGMVIASIAGQATSCALNGFFAVKSYLRSQPAHS